MHDRVIPQDTSQPVLQLGARKGFCIARIFNYSSMCVATERDVFDMFSCCCIREGFSVVASLNESPQLNCHAMAMNAEVPFVKAAGSHSQTVALTR